MSVYLDASVLVALFTEDAFTYRADAFCRTNAPILVVSDFAAAEFAAVVARHVRTRDIIAEDARAVFSTFDVWAARATQRIEIQPEDVALAAAFLRRLDLTLRTPDSINIAIAQRIDATLATFDEKMAVSAALLDLPVARM